MTTTLTHIPVVYDLPSLPDLASKYAALTSAATKEEYEAVRLGIGELRQLRVSVEKRRVELKADALKYGREVDRVAKALTEQLEAIEEPLKLLKAGVDEQRARAKEAARAAEEARMREQLAAEQARLEADRQRLAEEAAEREELARERAEIEAEKLARQQAVLQAERERLAAERAKLEIDAQLARVAEGERQRQEREEIARERAALEAEKADRAQTEAERVAAEALKPDIEKVRAFAQRIRDVNETYPHVESQVARDLVSLALHELEQVALALDGIKP
jgi:hypothetical protein